MTIRRRIVTWAEEDAYTSWRKFYCYLQRPGVVKSIKRATHRRERREARADIEEQLRDYYDERGPFQVAWSPEDGEYVATCREFPSLSWLAPNPEDALQGLLALLNEQEDRT